LHRGHNRYTTELLHAHYLSWNWELPIDYLIVPRYCSTTSKIIPPGRVIYGRRNPARYQDRNLRPIIVPGTSHWNNWVWVILEMFHANSKFWNEFIFFVSRNTQFDAARNYVWSIPFSQFGSLVTLRKSWFVFFRVKFDLK
jgi:hypothetical protein